MSLLKLGRSAINLLLHEFQQLQFGQQMQRLAGRHLRLVAAAATTHGIIRRSVVIGRFGLKRRQQLLQPGERDLFGRLGIGVGLHAIEPRGRSRHLAHRTI